MCGRFVSATDADGLVRFFTIDDRQADDVPPSWNVAPTDQVHAVVEHEGRRVLVAFRWGLVPAWAEDPKIGSRLINARAETAGDKPAYRRAFTRRRCLIPADGFYEWERRPDGGRQPHLLAHPDGEPLAFAGLWEVWRGGEGAPLRTCTILTMAASDTVRPIHPRMPVMLPSDRWGPWLDRGCRDREAVDGILQLAGAPLVTHPVTPEVNTPRNNHPGLIAPWQP